MPDDEPYEDEEGEYPGPFGLGEKGDPDILPLWRKRNADARVLLGDMRLRAFFKTGWTDLSDWVPFSLMYESLMRGEGLDILSRLEGEFGFVLSARKLEEHIYRIEFGYRSPDDWSEGAVFRVKFDATGAVEDIDVEAEEMSFLNGFGR